MAIPTFVAAGTQGAGAGAVVPGLPAGAQADDILVLGVDSNSSQPAAAPTGYTQFPDSPQDVGGLGSACLSVFWKRHSGSETDPTVADTGNHTNAVIIAIRGCITTGDPFDVTAGNVQVGVSTTVTIPGDTTTVADCLIVALATHSTDTLTAQFSAWANADLSDVTERVDNSTDAGGGGGIGIATGGKATAGAYGNTTATLATSSEQGRMSIALKPAASGTAHSLAGVANGTSSVTGVASLGAALAGAANGAAIVAGALAEGFRLVGETAGSSTVVGYMTNEWILAGSIGASSSTTGTLLVIEFGASDNSTSANFAPVLYFLRKR